MATEREEGEGRAKEQGRAGLGWGLQRGGVATAGWLRCLPACLPPSFLPSFTGLATHPGKNSAPLARGRRKERPSIFVQSSAGGQGNFLTRSFGCPCGQILQVTMLSDKVQKRMASSVFITLASPGRDLYAEAEARPQKAPFLPYNQLPKEAGAPVGPLPWLTTEGTNPRSKGHPLHRPGDPSLPNGDVCAFCHKTIPPRAPALEAMKKQYHAECFTCRTCQQALVGQHYYQKDGRPLCVACYQNTLEKCAMCQALILTQIVRAMGNSYHPECFTCAVCARAIGDETFALDDSNQVYCLDDFYRKFASVCGACGKPIIPSEGMDSYKIECMGRNFHEDCYRCERCHILLSPEPTEEGCYPLGSRLLCKFCHIQQTKTPALLNQ